MSFKRNPNPRPRLPALLLALMLSWGVSAGLSVAHAEDTFPILKRMGGRTINSTFCAMDQENQH